MPVTGWSNGGGAAFCSAQVGRCLSIYPYLNSEAQPMVNAAGLFIT